MSEGEAMSPPQQSDVLDSAPDMSFSTPGSPFSMVGDVALDDLSDDFDLVSNSHSSHHDENEGESASGSSTPSVMGPGTTLPNQPDVSRITPFENYANRGSSSRLTDLEGVVATMLNPPDAAKRSYSAECVDPATWKLLLLKKLYKKLSSVVPFMDMLEIEQIYMDLTVEYMLDKEVIRDEDIDEPGRPGFPLRRCRFFMRSDYVALSAKVNVPNVDEETGADAVTTLPGILEPPKQIRSLLKLYVFNVIRHCDLRMETMLQEDIGGGPNPKFQFLRPSNPYHAYYQWYKSRWPKPYERGPNPAPLHTSSDTVNEFMQLDKISTGLDKWCDLAIILSRIPITVTQNKESSNELAEQDELKLKLCQSQLHVAKSALAASNKRITEMEESIEGCGPKIKKLITKIEFNKQAEELQQLEKKHRDYIRDHSTEISERYREIADNRVTLGKAAHKYFEGCEKTKTLQKENEIKATQLEEQKEHYEFTINELGRDLTRLTDELRILEWHHAGTSSDLLQSQNINKTMSKQVHAKDVELGIINSALQAEVDKSQESKAKVASLRSVLGDAQRELAARMDELRVVKTELEYFKKEFENKARELGIVKDSLESAKADSTSYKYNLELVRSDLSFVKSKLHRLEKGLSYPTKQIKQAGDPAVAPTPQQDLKSLKELTPRGPAHGLKPTWDTSRPINPRRETRSMYFRDMQLKEDRWTQDAQFTDGGSPKPSKASILKETELRGESPNDGPIPLPLPGPGTPMGLVEPGHRAIVCYRPDCKTCKESK